MNKSIEQYLFLIYTIRKIYINMYLYLFKSHIDKNGINNE